MSERRQDGRPKSVAIVGGGPAGLMAADVLSRKGHRVTVYDRMPSLGRKFLMAGRGGLNLTHSEELGHFLDRYGPARSWLQGPIENFPPAALRNFAEDLGQETFVGSSGRVFPQAIKASPLLRSWLKRLGAMGVTVRTRHRWTGFAPKANAGGMALTFDVTAPPADGRPAATAMTTVDADAVLLALGGASWPRLGSDGRWTAPLAARSIAIKPLRPSNCGFLCAWSDVFREKFAGTPLKRIVLSLASPDVSAIAPPEAAAPPLPVAGELLITKNGLEGGALYALSAPLRDAIEAGGRARVTIDLRPDIPLLDLASRLARPRGKATQSSMLRKAAGLSPVAIALLREAAIQGLLPPTETHGAASAADAARYAADLPREPSDLAALIKACPVLLHGTAGLDRAISSAGGLMRDNVDVRFMLKALPGVFAAGEMLDWEAPTGGYLLQGCFATAVTAAEGIDDWLQATAAE